MVLHIIGVRLGIRQNTAFPGDHGEPRVRGLGERPRPRFVDVRGTRIEASMRHLSRNSRSRFST